MVYTKSTGTCICIKYKLCNQHMLYSKSIYSYWLIRFLLNLLFQIFKRTSFIVLNLNPLNPKHTGKFILFALELDCQGQRVMRGNIYSSIKPFTNRLTLYPCSPLNSQWWCKGSFQSEITSWEYQWVPVLSIINTCPNTQYTPMR